MDVHNARSLLIGDMPDALSEIDVSSGGYRKNSQKDPGTVNSSSMAFIKGYPALQLS